MDGRSAIAFWRRDWFLALFLVLATFVAYQPAWNGKPIWDDEAHVTRPDLRSPHGLSLIWFKPGATQQYYPLVHSVFWIEHKIWHDAVLPYHLVNVFLHALSALLLLKILLNLQVPGAWLAAAIFALHPVQVESVAWISELKNTLSGTFVLSSALLYLRFDRTRNFVAYLVALALFLLGLMSKTVIATLPAAILVVLWWKRGRPSWKRDVAPLFPFFAVGIGAGLFTAWMERKFIGAHGAAFDLSIIERCLIAGRAFWFYLFKLFWPTKLIFIYPRWNVSQTISWQYLFPFAALLLVGVLWLLRRRARAPLAGVLLFAGLLFPALGFFNVYPFRFSFVADHFQYLASIGVITLAAAGVAFACNRWRPRLRAVDLFLPLALVILLGALTWRQSRLYADPIPLYQSTLNQNPDCWMAHNNLGNAFLQKGEVDEAVAHYRKVLELLPDDPYAHDNLANALLRKGETSQAVAHYRKASELRPDDAEVHNNLANALVSQGLLDEAIAQFQKTLELRSDRGDRRNAETHYNLANSLLQNSQIDEAIAHYQTALQMRPDYADAHNNLGNVLLKNGQIDEAIAHYQKGLKLQPNDSDTHTNLGNAFFQKGAIEEAVAHYRKALELRPDDAETRSNLIIALRRQGRVEEAMAEYEKARKQMPPP